MTEFVSIQKRGALKELRIPGDTIPEIVLKRVEKFGSSRAALRYKKDGIWNEYSWSDYLSYVEKLAGGAQSTGSQSQGQIASETISPISTKLY